MRLRDVLRHAQQRALDLGRTQQLEIGEDLFIRIGPGGRKFLLFGLSSEPTRQQAEDIASALELQGPVYGWHQGETLRSLTVVEPGAETPAPPPAPPSS